ncbi:hypothetical protein BV22DRAFT_1052750 [Leucogyrophana mollusca]|uniref:Uncharacterized protein n=1 Tax=Leucogyrophana mollusca TaxID=85980 RepID=A0ACB8ATY0_9AGAM|nr:hypothetical protein BV22DRAFT_1052750 [Leucogyrophana mollusca]
MENRAQWKKATIVLRTMWFRVNKYNENITDSVLVIESESNDCEAVLMVRKDLGRCCRWKWSPQRRRGEYVLPSLGQSGKAQQSGVLRPGTRVCAGNGTAMEECSDRCQGEMGKGHVIGPGGPSEASGWGDPVAWTTTGTVPLLGPPLQGLLDGVIGIGTGGGVVSLNKYWNVP